jgi:5'-nucleotidase/UDP-sugar diphosphatase
MTRREVIARSTCSLDDNADWIAQRKEAPKDQGPVLVLDAGDYSMGTAFAAATREVGGELQLM